MIMSAVISPEYIALFAIVIAVLTVITFTIILAGVPLYKRVQARLDKVTGKTRETLQGVRVIRAFNREYDEIEEFKKANDAHTDAQNFTGRIMALLNPLTAVVINIGIIAIVYMSSLKIDAGDMSQGDLFALYNYMSQILVELIKLANTVLIIVKAVACSHRIEAVMQTSAGMEIKPDVNNNTADSTYAVEFDNVTFTYEGAGAPSLEGIDFKVEKGSVVGIIGGTGSGKTTLVNLIPRFYDATKGQIKLFGRDVASYKLDELREQIGIVPQKAVLFKGSVRSNLLWGRSDATEDELWAALEVAQGKDFVAEKDGGLDAAVEQFGRNFSGGQRQRLTIARALVRKAPVIILDDSASALDFSTEAKLRTALRKLDYEPTVFIISQRTSSISHADLIIVLDEGRAVGMGTHDELLGNCSVYREIYNSQFKGGEQ
jgi:ABC-type multidrug transport system fused ATPase/permease subunit